MNSLSKIFFIVLFSTLIIQAQITEEYKQDKINSLSIISIDSASTKHYGGNAIEAIMRHRIVEAIPAIIENIWIQDPYYQTRFLHALWALGSPEGENLTLAYLDSVDNFAESHFTKYELKEIATELLFRIGNYSTYQYIFEAIDSVYPSINESVVNALPYIIEYVPQAKERAKNELLRIANECEDPVFRWYAASGLDEALGEEAVPSIINLFRNEEDSSPRGLIALHILSKYKRADAIMALKEQLLTDTNESVRGNIVDALILGANTLDVHKFILDHLENETSFWVKSLFYDDMFTIEPYLDSSISTYTMLDTLISYTTQSYGYEWLKDETYKTELLTKLTTAKTKLTSGDSLGCRTEVASFQNSVNQVYQDSTGSYPKYVSNAGYKFMYHYAQYILDRLLEAPTVEGLPVKLQDSQGNLLQGGYLQYYNGGWQDAINSVVEFWNKTFV